MKSGWQKERSWRCPRIQKLSKVSCIGPTLFGSFTIACHVVTRVRGEQGGTTGVLDRGIGENRERERERDAHTHTDKEAHGNAARQHRRHESSRRQSIRTLVYVYIYICMQTIRTVTTDQAGETGADTWSPTHTGEQDGDSAGSTRAFHGAESASREPTQKKAMENDREEVLGPSPATLRPL